MAHADATYNLVRRTEGGSIAVAWCGCGKRFEGDEAGALKFVASHQPKTETKAQKNDSKVQLEVPPVQPSDELLDIDDAGEGETEDEPSSI
jgi:hypothetical protein